MKFRWCLLFALAPSACAPFSSLAQSLQNDAQKQPVNHAARGKDGPPIPESLRPHPAARIIIPELTEVPVTLKDEIQSGANVKGSELLFFVTRDVYGPGHVLLITRGTPAVGRIVESKKYQSFGRAGKLVLTCDYVLAQDKTRIPLRGVKQETRGASQNGFTAAISGGTTAYGIDDGVYGTTIKGGSELARGAIGGIAWLGIGAIVDSFTYGKDAKLHVGKDYNVYVEADTLTGAPVPNVEPVSPGQRPQSAILTLKNGDFIAGHVVKEGDVYIVSHPGRPSTYRVSEVKSVQFAKDAGD